MTNNSLILGIDTSCDETSVAILKNGKEVLANVVSSQIALHQMYGGVVPEIASRAHTERIVPVVRLALKEAACRYQDLTGVAVTTTPGLIGCLLVGLSYAKSLSYSLNIPLTAVHHLKGHLMSAFLEHDPVYPFLGVVVSGGHTAYYFVRNFNDIELVGTTVDDAAGEAYDKVAKLLKLGYPGGPLVDSLAGEGNDKRFTFTRARVKKGPYFLSFSGLKTAVAQLVRQFDGNDATFIRDICASFQKEVSEALGEKIEMAAKEFGAMAIVLAGGVACNSRLRSKLREVSDKLAIPLLVPSPLNCTDNAAMIAYVGARQIDEGMIGALDLNAEASTPLSIFYSQR